MKLSLILLSGFGYIVPSISGATQASNEESSLRGLPVIKAFCVNDELNLQMAVAYDSDITICNRALITLSRPMDLTGKNVTIRCETPPPGVYQECIIRGKIPSSTLFNGSPVSVNLIGLHLREGDAGDGNGGAVSFTGGTHTIQSCRFEENRGSFGGAVYVTGPETKVSIRDSYFKYNEAMGSTGYGGAICADNQAIVEMSNTTLFVNRAKMNGSGIAALKAKVNIANSTIMYNSRPMYSTSPYRTGSIYSLESYIQLSSSFLKKNENYPMDTTIYIDDDKAPIGTGSGSGSNVICSSDVNMCSGVGSIYEKATITLFGRLQFNDNTNCDTVAFSDPAMCL